MLSEIQENENWNPRRVHSLNARAYITIHTQDRNHEKLEKKFIEKMVDFLSPLRK